MKDVAEPLKRTMQNTSPILVTGIHRSGTTWVGKMLAASSEVGYIWEPFNLLHRPGTCAARFDYYYQYLTDSNGNGFYDTLKSTIGFEYNIASELKALRSITDLRVMLKDYRHFSHCRRKNLRPLIKDPIAFFSAPYLAAKFNMAVLVMIRHPAGFASSVKRLGWSHDFGDFLKQRALMDDHLSEFREEINEFTVRESDIIDQAILMWKIIHRTVLRYKALYPGWIFLRHEDISRDPVGGFRSLYSSLGLRYDSSVNNTINEFSNSNNPAAATGNSQNLKLNSSENIYCWKHRLTGKEVSKIYTGVEEISKKFYSNADW